MSDSSCTAAGGPGRTLGFTVQPDSEDAPTHFSLKYSPPGPRDIQVGFNGLAGNLPCTNKNTVTLWSGLVPGVKKITTTPITRDNQPGSVVVAHKFQPVNYSITYDLCGPATRCAMLALPLGNIKVEAGPPTHVALDLLSATETSLRTKYETLRGYRPDLSHNWLGLWQGFVSPYTSLPPALQKRQITNGATEGILKLTKLKLSPDLDYTLIYFTGQGPLTAAAIIHFTVTEKSGCLTSNNQSKRSS